MHYHFYVKTCNRFTRTFMGYWFSLVEHKAGALGSRNKSKCKSGIGNSVIYWIFEHGIIPLWKWASCFSLWNLGINCFIWFSDSYSIYFNGCRLVMLRVDAKQGAPRDGNSLLEMFQVSAVVFSKCFSNRYLYYLVKNCYSVHFFHREQ